MKLAIMWKILGLLLLLKPELIWKIKHSWDVKDGEPTNGYIIFFKCVGIYAIIVGIVLFIIYIFK